MSDFVQEPIVDLENLYLKLSRNISAQHWYGDSEAVHLYIHILLKVCHYDRNVTHDGKNYSLKAGQFITGRKRLSAETGIHESKIERLLLMFERENVIEQKSNSRNRVVTLVSDLVRTEVEQVRTGHRTEVEQKSNSPVLSDSSENTIVRTEVEQKSNKQSNTINNNSTSTSTSKVYIPNDFLEKSKSFYEKEIAEYLIDDEWKSGYQKYVDFIFGQNDIKEPLTALLKIPKQLTIEEYIKITELRRKKNKSLVQLLNAIANRPDYVKKNQSVYLTLTNWLNREHTNGK